MTATVYVEVDAGAATDIQLYSFSQSAAHSHAWRYPITVEELNMYPLDLERIRHRRATILSHYITHMFYWPDEREFPTAASFLAEIELEGLTLPIVPAYEAGNMTVNSVVFFIHSEPFGKPTVFAGAHPARLLIHSEGYAARGVLECQATAHDGLPIVKLLSTHRVRFTGTRAATWR